MKTIKMRMLIAVLLLVAGLLLGMAGLPAAKAVLMTQLAHAGWVEFGSGSASGGGVSNSVSASHEPALVAFGDTAITAWAEKQEGADSEIYVKNWKGAAWHEYVEVSISGSASGGGVSNNSSNSYQSSVAVGADGRPIIAWTNTFDGNNEIYVRRWDGSAWVEMSSGSASGGGISNNIGNSVVPSLVVGPDGRPVIAWQQWVDNKYAIYLKRWNGSAWVEMGSGSASGSGISNNALSATAPSLAVGPDGLPVIAWQQTTPHSKIQQITYQQIYVRRWNGSAWVEMGSGSASSGGISNNNYPSEEPSLAVGADGMPVIAWEQSVRNGNGAEAPILGQIYVLHWNGSAWVEMGSGSASGRGISNNNGNSFNPSVTIRSDGRPIITWEDDSSGKNAIYVRRWDGSTWVEMSSGSASGGGISSYTSSAHDPSIAVKPDGQPIISWWDWNQGNSQIYAKSWTGSAWAELGGSATGGGISNNNGNSALPSLAIGTDGQAIVVWHDSIKLNYEIYARHWNGASWEEYWTSTTNGSASGEGISRNNGSSERAALTVDTDENPVVAWMDESNDNYEIYLKRWSGSAWLELGNSASGGGISNNSGHSAAPALAYGPDGLIVAWNDQTAGRNQIYIRRWNGSAWVELGSGSASGGGISSSGQNAYTPSVVVLPGGKLLVAWADTESGNGEIYIKRWNGSAWEDFNSGSSSGGGISNTPGGSFRPSLVLDSNGRPIVAWEDSSNGHNEIYVRRWNGSTWVELGSGSASGGGISKTSGESLWPSLSIHPKGFPVVTWQDGSGADLEVYLRAWNGTSWEEMSSGSASGGGISDESYDSEYQSLAFLANGTAIVAWEQGRGSSPSQIYARQFAYSCYKLTLSHSGQGSDPAPSPAKSPDCPAGSYHFGQQISLTAAPASGWRVGSWAGTANDAAAGTGNQLIMPAADHAAGVAYTMNAGWLEIGSGSGSGGGVSSSSAQSHEPALVTIDNTAFMAWEEAEKGADSEIYLRRWDGSAWVDLGGSSSSGGISDNSGKSWRAALAVDDDQRPIAAWMDNSSGNFEIYLERWDGAAWVELGGSASGGGVSSNPGLSAVASVAYSPDGIIVAWNDQSSGSSQIYVRRWNGAAWVEMGSGSATGGGISNTSGNAYTPSVAVLPDGNVLIVWADNDTGIAQIYGKRWNGLAWEEFSSGSASIGGISNTIGDSFRPSLVVDQNGRPMVAWEDNSNNNMEIYFKRWNGTTWEALGGSTQFGGISNTSGDSLWPSLAGDPGGMPVVSWQDAGSSDLEIYVRRWNGANWEEVGSGSATGGGVSDASYDSELQSLAFLANGTAVMAWEQDFGQNPSQIYVRQYIFSCYQLSSSHAGQGSDPALSPTSSQGCSAGRYNFGEQISLSAGPAAGWAAAGWQGTVNDASTSVTNQVTMPAHDHTVSVSYTALCSALSLTHTGQGIDPDPSPTNSQGCPDKHFVVGEQIILSAAPASGWLVGGWTGTADDAGTAVLNELTMPAGDHAASVAYTRHAGWLEIGSASGSGGGVSSSAAGSHEPALIAVNDKAIMAWEEAEEDADSEIFVRRWDGSAWVALGGSASSGGISDNSGRSWRAALTADADGRPIAAWTDNSSGNFEIYLKRWDGAKWVELGGSATGGGISDNPGLSAVPSLADNPQGIVVAWNDKSVGNSQIYVRRWNGSAWEELGFGSADGGGISSSPINAFTPSVAVLPDGQVVIAWADTSSGNGEIYIKRWNEEDGIWQEFSSGSASGGGISSSSGGSFRPSLVIDSLGRPMVAWEDSSNGHNEIYVRYWNGSVWDEMGSGSASGGGISSSSGESIWPALAISSGGVPVVSWQDGSSGDAEIYVRRWDGSNWVELDNGSAFSGGVSDAPFDSELQSLAFLADGTAILAWEQGRGDYPSQIYVRKHDALTPLPGKGIYLPAQEVGPGNGWQAGVQVQNSGSAQAMIGYTGIAANGATSDCGEVQTLPGASANFLTFWGCPAGHPPFSAGVVRSDQPGAAIASIINAPSGVAGGQYRGINAANDSKEIFFPLVKHNHNGRTTAFSVQNTGEQAAEITAVFKVNGQTYSKGYSGVPAKASVLILPADAGVPTGFGQVGSLTVTGSRPLAGASLEHEHNVAVADNLQTSSAFSPADNDQVLYCPLYRNAHAAKKQTSGVQVQNVSSTAQTITLDYTPLGAGAKISKAETVQPGASVTFYAPSVGIPSGSLGSVTVSSAGDIVAVTNEGGTLEDGRRIMTTYTCFPASSATKRVIIPLYKEFYKGNTSGIQVQNVSGNGSTATVQMAYTATNSNAQVVLTHSIPIPDGGSITFWGVSSLSSPPGITAVSGNPAALAGTYGSVVITSDKPIVAIANETTFGADGSNQDSKNYEGFNE